MSILSELDRRFREAISKLAGVGDERIEVLRRSQDARFGDYQANFAMALGKRLGKPPRELASEVATAVDVADICEPPEVAGPGFINLRICNDWLADRLKEAVADERLGVPAVESPRTFVIDYSGPNVAKPMHVGHVRSTFIGDSIARILRFLGHTVVTDNHLGDWGTQFGMIIYGYRHFCDQAAYRREPVTELARLYRLVRQLMDYWEAKEGLAHRIEKAVQQETLIQSQRAKPGQDKKAAKELRRLESQLEGLRDDIRTAEAKIAAVEGDAALASLALAHRGIAAAVLAETARLHAGDEENLSLWRQFLPVSLSEIDEVYRRVGIRFDHTLGESFYHDKLSPLVDELVARGLARESQGAVCIFFPGQDAPMIIRKKDGAYLYATTDLATLRYRMETWRPDAILYVVDFRQGLHFEQLFATARLWGYGDVELKHVSFGTVLGDDGRPFRTRSGDTVGLKGLLDEAIRRAHKIVADNDDAKPDGPELSAEERARVAEIVGLGALKYADLSQNRESDYVFSYDKMLAMNGNTATYMQYAYARVRSIFARGNVDSEGVRRSGAAVLLETPAERALALELLRFAEAIDLAIQDYRPHQLTSYLFELANSYSSFFEQCPVLKAPSEELRQSRLLLCELTARTIRQGLALLGIDVVEKM